MNPKMIMSIFDSDKGGNGLLIVIILAVLYSQGLLHVPVEVAPVPPVAIECQVP